MEKNEERNKTGEVIKLYKELDAEAKQKVKDHYYINSVNDLKFLLAKLTPENSPDFHVPGKDGQTLHRRLTLYLKSAA